MRRRIVIFVLALLTALGALAPTASAQRLIGFDSLLNWPCPGPVP